MTSFNRIPSKGLLSIDDLPNLIFPEKTTKLYAYLQKVFLTEDLQNVFFLWKTFQRFSFYRSPMVIIFPLEDLQRSTFYRSPLGGLLSINVLLSIELRMPFFYRGHFIQFNKKAFTEYSFNGRHSKYFLRVSFNRPDFKK